MTKVKTADAVRWFGTKSFLATCLGCTRATVQEWGVYVPASREKQIHALIMWKIGAKKRAKVEE